MSTDSTVNSVNSVNTEVEAQSQPIIPKKIGRVFLLEHSQNVDITPAFEYGPIVPLFKSTCNDDDENENSRKSNKSDRPSMWKTEEFQAEIIKRLLEYNYDPEIDYLLVAGHVIPIVIFTCTVVAEWENVQVLFWSSGFRKYMVRKL